ATPERCSRAARTGPGTASTSTSEARASAPSGAARATSTSQVPRASSFGTSASTADAPRAGLDSWGDDVPRDEGSAGAPRVGRGGPQGEPRSARVPHDALGDGSGEEVLEARSPVSRDHDEVRADLLRVRADRVSGGRVVQDHGVG